MLDFNGKVAVVTGASRGIGRAIATMLAGRGALVVAAARGENAAETASAIAAAGGRAERASVDVTDPASVDALIGGLRNEVGRIDILVNNAAIMPEDADDDLEELEIIRETMQTNVYGALLLSRMAIPIMKSRRYGRIVNLSSSMAALSEMGAGYIAYRLSKTGVNVMTRVVAAETEGMGILVNSLDPGWVQTSMGGSRAPRSLAEGADTITWLATLPDSGPTGLFFRDRKPIAW